MADHSKPVLTDNYTDVLDQVRGRFEDQAKGFDPANTSATNIQTNTIRWTSASNKWQKWNGTSWTDLSSLYAINISGNAGTVTDGVYTVGNQTIAGVKTFSNTLIASSDVQVGTFNDGGKLTLSGATGFAGTGLSIYETSTGNNARLRISQDSGAVIYNATFGSGNNRHVWQVASTEHMTLDSNGNLGVGTTPFAWSSGWRSLEVGPFSSVSGDQVNDGGLSITNNAYASSATQWVYKNLNSRACRYFMGDGVHRWFTAPSGTAGQPISFTQAMTLDSNGNLGVGTSSPSGASGKVLEVNGGAGQARFVLKNDTTGSASTDGSQIALVSNQLVIQNRENAGISFETNGSERVQIDSSGKLILSAANQGIQFADGTTQTTAASSGSYTPTLSNVSSGLTISSPKAQWIRVGNVVTVTFEADVATASATTYFFNITIPTTASLSGTWVGGGIGGDVVSGNLQSVIFGRVGVASASLAAGRVTTQHAQSYRMHATFSYTAA
jgi:hypothetical protein